MENKNEHKSKPIAIKDSLAKNRVYWMANEYAVRINNAIIPLMRSLGIKPNINNVIKYASSGGKDRLKSEYFELSGATAAPFLHNMSEKAFESKVLEFGEYKEFVTDWDAASLLYINDNEEVLVDESKFEKTDYTFLKEEGSIDTYNKINKICDSINELFSKDYDMNYDLLNQLFFFDFDKKEFCVNTQTMTDSSLLEIKNGSNGLRPYEKAEKCPKWFKDLEEKETLEKTERFNSIKKTFNL